MPLSPGTRLGPYEVVALVGEGGMGQVYRARDTKLNRDVALKVLPEAFVNDPERLARFKREAQVLASLNHPNIAAIYGLEDSGSVQALVMEFVEGETLAARLAQGYRQDVGRVLSDPPKQNASPSSAGLHITDALSFARQIADGLQAAHEKTVTHRDLKPANIAITPEGVVKVLDFGLAKAMGPAGGAHPSEMTNSPTLSLAATRAGVILGTAAYMSPEQAKGREADRRSDIWAFGCVLYEMLTGTRAFGGEDMSDTLAAVLLREPDWAALPASVPPAIRTLARRCLEKDRKRRIADISTALFVIDEPAMVAAAVPAAELPAAAPSDLRGSPRTWMGWAHGRRTPCHDSGARRYDVPATRA